MPVALIWPLLKALLLIAPELWNEIKAGRIRAKSQQEVLLGLKAVHRRRVIKAIRARQAAQATGIDPNDRSKR
jgi:hypothetical protein